MLHLLLLTVLAARQARASSDYYTAAVVELATSSWPRILTGDELLVANAGIYVEYMYNASLSQADIIVFPEGGLVGRHNEGKAIELPPAVDKATPCDNTTAFHQVLVMLSCSARRFRMYVVVNLDEVVNNNTYNKTEIYTTNVAFNRNGTVVARYRKYHPYGKSVDKPPLELQYFETDFGVTFGMLISFDIQFLEPGIILAREYGIKHFVFPHCWISALPFFTAVQTQWAWAYSLDVVVLASGCNDPSSGATGSGLYLGRRGALQYLQTSEVTSTMIIAIVPKSLVDHDERYVPEEHPSMGSPPDPDVHQNVRDEAPGTTNSLFLLRDYVDVYESHLLLSTEDVASLVPHNLNQNSSIVTRITTETSVCQNMLCCNFQVTISSTFNSTPPAEAPRADDFSRLYYRLVAFDGVRSYGGGVATGGVQLCGIISCVNESMSSCGLAANHASAQVAGLGPLLKATTVFEAASISASFTYNNTFVYPDILVTGTGHNFGALVSSDSFSFLTTGPNNGTLTASLKMEVPVPYLVTAAVYARQFDRDGQKRTELPFTSQAQRVSQGVLGIFALLMFIFFNIIKKC